MQGLPVSMIAHTYCELLPHISSLSRDKSGRLFSVALSLSCFHKKPALHRCTAPALSGLFLLPALAGKSDSQACSKIFQRSKYKYTNYVISSITTSIFLRLPRRGAIATELGVSTLSSFGNSIEEYQYFLTKKLVNQNHFFDFDTSLKLLSNFKSNNVYEKLSNALLKIITQNFICSLLFLLTGYLAE